ncbi:MAG: transposase [Flavobacteriia bacterium]|nr:transposase [Flavobacteriia bacterium]OIP46813.1 MAG: transposase [Flavobacteriaceae bacterium CG2_30_31_66]PIV96377.1 MAG: transposase [Flavobacteriaceae bacterium CG17_big_fil_post_rev_8_21_14_2_50_31_13]PIX12048.1 MAG: transposase [Flavobacteriaceae bacterium CG_4_8_14_3_um_filter_31_8]PIY15501.1 MAG: transposase [Flavobacteriaceae bacterium CG_4_10_14_3_um_filter_31_253]PIZ11684.1 MAG: transposase [Flavobacteriaceae bacterium CG_4_10_14_0_8_um_filter_31_99]PJC10827.1 MAG: transposase [
MSRKYKFREANEAYFISFATVYWIDVFTRVDYFDIMIESFDYCRKQKGIELYGYCIMPSHVHLIFRSSLGDPSGLIRDLKGFTSKKMLKAIEENPQESRKEWLLWLFEKAGMKNSNVQFRQFWQQNNQPIEIWSLKVFEQKLNYIHNNPVEAGFVTNPIDWKYSSTRNYGNDDQTILEIDLN